MFVASAALNCSTDQVARTNITFQVRTRLTQFLGRHDGNTITFVYPDV